MRLILVLLPLALAGGLGYVTGRLGKRRAVSKSYTEVLPVIRETRKLLVHEPFRDGFDYNSYRLQQQLVLDEIDKYEAAVRAL